MIATSDTLETLPHTLFVGPAVPKAAPGRYIISVDLVNTEGDEVENCPPYQLKALLLSFYSGTPLTHAASKHPASTVYELYVFPYAGASAGQPDKKVVWWLFNANKEPLCEVEGPDAAREMVRVWLRLSVWGDIPVNFSDSLPRILKDVKDDTDRALLLSLFKEWGFPL